MAELLNSFFSSVFTREDRVRAPEADRLETEERGRTRHQDQTI